MALSANQRERYARHLLLAEIGEAQQAALCGARVTFAPGVDGDVLRVARDYLRRAGVANVEVAATAEADSREGPTSEDVERVAGRPALEPAAAALLGAFEAVEALKQHTGVGTPAAFPPDLSLCEVQP